jgi:hypothetical protein
MTRPELDAGRTEDVPGVAHVHGDSGNHLDRRVIGNGPQLIHGPRDVVEIEQRPHLPVGGQIAVVPFGLAHGQVRGIPQQYGHQVRAGDVGVDRPAKTALHQQWQAAAMVHVCVAQHHGVDAAGVEGKWQAIARWRVASALHHAAVQQ